MGQPGVDARCQHLPAMGSDCAPMVQCAQGNEQNFCRCHRPGGRNVQPLELGRLTHSPKGEFKDQVGQIRVEDFRTIERHKALVHILGPQSVADAWSGAARTAPALVCRCFGYRTGFKPGHAPARRKLRLVDQARIHHHPDTLDGQGCFCNGCGQNDFSVSWS